MDGLFYYKNTFINTRIWFRKKKNINFQKNLFSEVNFFMKVSHCIITFESDEKCTVKNRKNYDFEKDEWKEEGYPVEIPDQFKDLLFCLFSSWLWDYEYDVNKVEFTYVRDEKLGESISVVNPRDHFSHKVGRERAVGRLRRAAGVLTRIKEGVVISYKPYEVIPETIILY